MDKKTILDYETVDLDVEKKELVIIDQTKLPGSIEIIRLSEAQDIWDAIYLLKVRGAPAIGVAAAFGLYILATQIKDDTVVGFYKEFSKYKDFLNSARPTAVNLSWALKRMDRLAQSMLFGTNQSDKASDIETNQSDKASDIGTNQSDKASDIETKQSDTAGSHETGQSTTDIMKDADRIKITLDALCREALLIKEEDIAVCKAIGENGLTLVKPGDGILTHCNAGQLATCRYGTATAPIYLGQERGYNFKVYADETRPLLQGARLTSFELYSAGVDVTLICDNMSATVMKQGRVNAVFVGCDRVAANGDTANKIGTSVVATVAKRYNVPVYICAPTSTIDLDTPTGDDIKIEQRPDSEVTEMWYKERMAPEGVKVFNPAFDVTDHDLIAGIVTENGIAYEPYTESLRKMVNKQERN